MPILNFETLELVPEGLREVAKTGEDGKITVNVVAAASLDEFRDNNIRLSRERDALTAERDTYRSIVGEDPTTFQSELEQLKLTQQRVKDGDLKEGRAVEEAATKRTEEMRKQFEDQVRKEAQDKLVWQQKHDALDARYKQSQVANAVSVAAMSADSGVEPSAVGDIVRLAYETFRVGADGRVEAYNGESPVYGADGVTPMGPKEWLGKLREEKRYFFVQSGGGGAGGDSTTNAKTIHGHTAAQLKGMSATERLAAANGEAPARL